MKKLIIQKNTYTKKNRIFVIDLLKTIAIIMVISLHSGLLQTDFISNPSLITKIQYAIRLVFEGVPIFIIVNGFLIIHKENFDYKKHIFKIIKLFGLLLIWTFIITILSKIIYKEEINIKEIIKYDLYKTDANSPYAGVLWFLQSLIKLYLFFPILKVIYDNNRKVYHFLWAIVVFFTIITDLLFLISDALKEFWTIEYMEIIYKNLDKFNIIGGDKWFVLFFMFGGYLYDCKQVFKNKKIIIMSSILGLLSWIFVFYFGYIISKSRNSVYSNNFVYYTIFILMIITGLFAILYNYKGKTRIFRWLITLFGQNTMGIYFIHILIIRLLSNYWAPFHTLNLVERLGIVMAILILCTGLSVIIRKVPIIKKLVEI